MAISEPEIPDTAQHYLVCDNEDCNKNCLFYCNFCHRSMCEQCRENHLKSPASKNHAVFLYKQRKRNQNFCGKMQDSSFQDPGYTTLIYV